MIRANNILKNAGFWSRLEFSATRWLSSASEKDLRRYWIDGFMPERSRPTNRGLEVRGLVWVAHHKTGAQYEYGFVICLPSKIVQRQEEEFTINCVTLDHTERFVEVLISKKNEPNKQPQPIRACGPLG